MIINILILAVALAIDAMLVSFSYGLILNQNKYKYAIIFAVFFGFFQFLMPVIGWFLSGFIYDVLALYSKWIVFVVFIFLGIKFLKSAFIEEKIEYCEKVSIFCVFCLAIATSIDALGAGVSLKFQNMPIIFSALLIGIVTFLLSFSGFFVTSIFQKIPHKPVEILGALLLIYLAVKALL